MLKGVVAKGGDAAMLSEAFLLTGDAAAALEAAPKGARGAGQRGRCLMRLGRAKEAVTEFKQVRLRKHGSMLPPQTPGVRCTASTVYCFHSVLLP